MLALKVGFKHQMCVIDKICGNIYVYNISVACYDVPVGISGEEMEEGLDLMAHVGRTLYSASSPPEMTSSHEAFCHSRATSLRHA